MADHAGDDRTDAPTAPPQTEPEPSELPDRPEGKQVAPLETPSETPGPSTLGATQPVTPVQQAPAVPAPPAQPVSIPAAPSQAQRYEQPNRPSAAAPAAPAPPARPMPPAPPTPQPANPLPAPVRAPSNPYAPYTTPPPPSSFRHSRPPHLANGASNGPGYQGSQGYQGNQGNQSSQGYQGNQGYTGNHGNQGYSGSPGYQDQNGQGYQDRNGQGYQDQNGFPGQQAYSGPQDGGARYGYQTQDNQAAAASAMARPLTNFPSDHLGARDRGARRFAVRPSAGIGEAPVGEIGRVIFAIVQEQPGIHFRGLARAANLTSAGQLRHHLDRLERHGLVVELEDGRYKRFFAAGDHEPELRPGLARFSRMVPRRIGKLLLAGPMNRTELRRSLGCADSTLGYHLNRMLRSGDLQKQRTPTGCNYALADEAFVRRLLQQPDGRPMPGPGGQSGQAQVPAQQDPYGWGDPHPAVDGVGSTRPPRPAPAPSSPAAPDGFDDVMPGPA